MTHRRWKLRIQLTLAMIFTALTALGVFIIGMVAFYVLLQNYWLDSLGGENRATLEALIEGETISKDSLTTLVGAFSAYWGGGRYANAELMALVVMMLPAVAASVLVGLFVARRLSAPLEVVTSAALDIAGGNLSQDLPKVESGVLETQELLSAFSKMTKELEQAEREATESAAAIAHELRTPLTVLRGRLQGLGDGVFEPTKEMTDGLVAQVDTLARIVDELSLLSRLSAGQFAPQAIQIDLAEEVKRVLTPMRPDLEQRGMALETSLSPVSLLADPVLIRQALAAMIENAKKYAADGNYLKVETYTRGAHAYLVIADRGPGVDPSERTKVFDRWWRGEPSRNREEGGTGLGLSVVMAIAKAHGGHVVAEANGDQGAKLVVTLPRST